MYIMMLLPMHWVETRFNALCQTLTFIWQNSDDVDKSDKFGKVYILITNLMHQLYMYS